MSEFSFFLLVPIERSVLPVFVMIVVVVHFNQYQMMFSAGLHAVNFACFLFYF